MEFVITSVAVGIKQGCGAGEACAVGVVVDSPHSRVISTTVFPWDVDRIADAAISQPARITLVQASLPGKVELPNCGQLGSQGLAVGGSCGKV